MKVLCYLSPAKGHLFPTVPILLELQRRGHQVALRCMAGEVERMRGLGFAVEPTDPAVAAIEHDDYGASGAMGPIKRAVAVFVQRANVEVPDLQAAIGQEQPDVLLIDTNAWGASAVAEVSGLPWAQIQHFPTPLPSADVPPFGPGLKPLAGPIGRLRNRLLQPLVLGAVERVVLGPANAVRASVGAAPVRGAADLYTRPPLTIYQTSRAFEYPRTDWPAGFCFVGPLAWDPPAAPYDVPAGPLALVTTSSEFQDDGELVTTALAALAPSDLTVLATMPAGVSVTEMPANARVEEFVPHSQVLPSCAVAITHGGMGVTQKALAAGVPVVVVPFGRDQAEVGRRAEAAGAGVFLPRKRLTPESLRDAVTRARALDGGAKRLASRMAAEGGAPLAADRLEALSRSAAR